MSEEIETPVAPVEEKSGSVIPGVIGGAAGGFAAYHFGNKAIVKNGIKAALEGKEEPKGIKKIVDSALDGKGTAYKEQEAGIKALHDGISDATKVKSVKFVADATDKAKTDIHVVDAAGKSHVIKGGSVSSDLIGKELKEPAEIKALMDGDAAKYVADAETNLSTLTSKLPSQKGALDALKAGMEDHTKITSAEFKKAAEGDLHELHFKVGADTHVVNLKKLPEGHAVGTVEADKIEALFKGDKAPIKGIVKEGEKELLNGIKSAEKIGFKSLETSGKAKVIGLAVGGVAVGYGVLNALFGGKHRQAAIQRTADASVEQGQARA